MAISDMLLPEFDQEMSNTRKMLERIPETIPDYKPHQKSMPFSHLAGHVAQLPGWAKETMTKEELVLDPTKFTPFLPKSRKEVLDAFEKAVTEGRAAIGASADLDFSVMWSLKTADGHTIFSMPRIAVLRGVVMNHLIHHRAQLGVYLRLNEIEIPGMYGPSADEMKMWEQAQKTA
jgi:uncharacterized damage-inducible protein DinB